MRKLSIRQVILFQVITIQNRIIKLNKSLIITQLTSIIRHQKLLLKPILRLIIILIHKSLRVHKIAHFQTIKLKILRILL